MTNLEQHVAQFFMFKKVMKQTKQSRMLPASKVKRLFARLGAELTEGMERVMATADGNTIVFHMPGGTINITINEEGGVR